MDRTPRLHVKMLEPKDLIPHLGKGERHWKEGRSAHALCTTWFKANGIPSSVRSVLRTSPTLEGLELVDAFLERLVDLGDGRKPSQTDLMAICADQTGLCVVGVEGKVDEPFGELVEQWRDGSPTKEARLRNLCAMLGLKTESAGTLRYQLIHRTASVILESRRYRTERAVLLVHSFCQNRTGLSDFARFAEALGFEKARGNQVIGPRRVQGIALHLGWVADTVPSPSSINFKQVS